jgi:hypothetical protein
MLLDLLLRFAIGGLVVSAFAVICHVVKPKVFAGIFGAAPSVSLATLGLTYHRNGALYAAAEGRSMIVGAIALALYSITVSYTLLDREWNAALVTVASWALWLAVAFGIWGVFPRG